MPYYVDKMLTLARCADIHASPLPAEPKSHLLKATRDRATDETCTWPYRQVVMAALWFVKMVAHEAHNAVSDLTQHLQVWTAPHIAAAKKLLAYCKSVRETTTKMRRPPNFNIISYSDCAYASEPLGNDKPLRGKGCCIIGIMGSGVIFMMSKLVASLATSASDAEKRQVYITMQKLIGIAHLLAELHLPRTSPAIIYEDNMNCVASSRNTVSASAMKQLLVESMAVKEACDRGEIRLIHKPRVDMHADIGTKTLPSPKFDSTVRRSETDALLKCRIASIGGLCQQRLCCPAIDAMAPAHHRERVFPLGCE